MPGAEPVAPSATLPTSATIPIDDGMRVVLPEGEVNLQDPDAVAQAIDEYLKRFEACEIEKDRDVYQAIPELSTDDRTVILKLTGFKWVLGEEKRGKGGSTYVKPIIYGATGVKVEKKPEPKPEFVSAGRIASFWKCPAK